MVKRWLWMSWEFKRWVKEGMGMQPANAAQVLTNYRTKSATKWLLSFVMLGYKQIRISATSTFTKCLLNANQ
jgi:hypothetical protein